MVRENQVHTASVYVEVVAKILAAHRRTLTVPAGETIAPRTGPAHDVLGLCLLPESEVHLVVFLLCTCQIA